MQRDFPPELLTMRHDRLSSFVKSSLLFYIGNANQPKAPFRMVSVMHQENFQILLKNTYKMEM
jgi:hypothetical protein